MSLNLSKRMQAIIDMCEPCNTIVDVGTDHGKVAIAITNLGLSQNVIAVDNKVGPLKVCESNAKEYIVNKDVNFKTLLSDGISNIDKKVESGIIIAGMGFDQIRSILVNIDEYNFKYLILSPHTKITELMKYLDGVNMDITKMKNVFEDDKYYYIIKAVRR